MNPQQLLPFIGATISIGGIIFQTGKHAEKIDFLVSKVEAQGEKVEYNDKNMCEIKSDLKTLAHDVSAIKEDVHDVKDHLNKI
jgi:peptidoglycan hydrolase CwlO-like protein